MALPFSAQAQWFSSPRTFSLDDVTERARALAARPYEAPVSNLPPVFAGMQFADYMKIQPRQDRFEWQGQGTPYRLNFYHQGMQFNAPVRINEINGTEVREIPYEAERFDFGNLNFDKGGAYATAFLLALVAVAAIIVVSTLRPSERSRSERSPSERSRKEDR